MAFTRSASAAQALLASLLLGHLLAAASGAQARGLPATDGARTGLGGDPTGARTVESAFSALEAMLEEEDAAEDDLLLRAEAVTESRGHEPGSAGEQPALRDPLGSGDSLDAIISEFRAVVGRDARPRSDGSGEGYSDEDLALLAELDQAHARLASVPSVLDAEGAALGAGGGSDGDGSPT